MLQSACLGDSDIQALSTLHSKVTVQEFENTTYSNWLFWICGCGRLGQGNHVINVTSSFSNSFVFKMFTVHTKTQSRRFQIPPV